MSERKNRKTRKDMNIIDYRPYLSDTSFQQLRECYLCFVKNQSFASAIWGAVFLESFLNEFADHLDVPRTTKEELSDQIGRIRQYRKEYNKEQSPDKPYIPIEIITRCEEIRNIRNRLVHHGLPKNHLEDDAKSIWNHLRVILDWYLGTKSSITSPVSPPESLPKEKEIIGIPVFISTITPHNEFQAYFLEMFDSRLKDIGIQPVHLKQNNFDKRNPLGTARSVIETCRGLIALGLERSHAYFLRDKEGSDMEKDVIHRKYTSSWLHLEAGIAHALGLDIFVLCEKKICNDGIFDRYWNTYIVTELNTLDEDSAELEEFLNHLKEWVKLQQQSKSP